MYRYAIETLKKWKDKSNRKPLVIEGARQVGKTWLIKEFGASYYKNHIYINFDNNSQMKELFAVDMDIVRIIKGIELYAGKKIDVNETLLIFDEIQEVPNALKSLKYFNENAPEYQIICAGSRLGIAMHQGTSFPVGKVEFMNLYPLSFNEFVEALGKKQFIELLKDQDYNMATTFKNQYIDLLKKYYFVGGMPEAVNTFADNGDFYETRKVQKSILTAYDQDFSKHAPPEIVTRIRMLWNSLPAQLSKENKKFIYGIIKSGARAKDYEIALTWLKDCGLVHQVNRVSTPNYPLKSYEDLKAFKLYSVDIGLLGCMSELDAKVILEGNSLFKEFKGALTEQYVLQELMTLNDISTYYWTNDRGSAELDFLLQKKDKIIPVEVKAETNLKAKSLRTFCEKYDMKNAIRISMADYKKEDWVTNLPLWAVEAL